jgi:hypothetical protein
MPLGRKSKTQLRVARTEDEDQAFNKNFCKDVVG